MAIISEMIEEKKIRPVMDKVFSLDEIKEAHKYYENGKNNGKIVIRM